jgi:hypothetical protein
MSEAAGRFEAPFVMKVSFYAPSSKNAAKNAAHIKYIGTRPGAVIENEGVLDITDSSRPDPETAAGHVVYAHERPGSHGLFSSGEKHPVLGEVQKELQEHNGVVWRFILSLTEKDAKRLGYDERSAWEDSLRSVVPLIAEKMGIKESNLRWVAAFHQEKGHPHVHLVLWEKDPHRRKGALSRGERTDVKKVFMRELYADERVRLLQEKTAMRDLIRQQAKSRSYDATDLHREILWNQYEKVRLEMLAIGGIEPGIPSKLRPEETKELLGMMKELAELMPGQGRVALKLMPEEAKQKANEIAEFILKQPKFKESYDRYMKAVEDMTRLHTINPTAIQQAKDNAHNDIRDRVANVFLKGASIVQIQIKNQRERFEKLGEKVEQKLKDRQYRLEKQALQQQARVVNTVWKSIWHVLEKESIRQEAKSEIEKRKELQRKARAKQRENEQDRER